MPPFCPAFLLLATHQILIPEQSHYIVNLIFIKTGRKALPEETQIENASKPD
jgi:hypothetical protein